MQLGGIRKAICHRPAAFIFDYHDKGEDMIEFIEVAASKQSLARRSLVFGVGINDADYMSSYTVDGVRVRCPFYVKWKGMLERAYCDTYKAKWPTYAECTVDERWHIFSAFKLWMNKQEWAGKDLDKDILIPGNKHYSPDTCCFVSKEINSLIKGKFSKRSSLPAGVYLTRGRYQSTIYRNSRNESLGYFDDPKEASSVYRAHKAEYFRDLALEQTDGRIKVGLMSHAALIDI